MNVGAAATRHTHHAQTGPITRAAPAFERANRSERSRRMLSEHVSSALALTPLVLGQLLPQVSSGELGQWIVVAAAAAVIANQGAALWKTLSGGLKEQPPPAETYMTKALCLAQHAGLDRRMESGSNRMSGIETSIKELRQEFKADMRGMHDRTNAILAGVARLEGRIERKDSAHDRG
jgi:hypothetical protein